MTTRQRVSSGTMWEDRVGYSRAVRVGPFGYVSGTTAVDAAGTPQHPGDAEGQMRYALEKALHALEELGFDKRHVVRTRMFVTDIAAWPAMGDAHGAFFRDVRPCATMVEVSKLIDPALLVEVELDAVDDGAVA